MGEITKSADVRAKKRTAIDAFSQEGGSEYNFDVAFERSRELPRNVELGDKLA